MNLNTRKECSNLIIDVSIFHPLSVEISPWKNYVLASTNLLNQREQTLKQNPKLQMNINQKKLKMPMRRSNSRYTSHKL